MAVAPATAEALLDLVRRSDLIPAGRLETFLSAASLPADARQAAEVLVRGGVLTHYQAQHLLAGRYKGFLLGPYRLLEPIGQGGMGTVYLGEHTRLHRRVALKVFPPDKIHDETALARFYREGRAAAGLDHANIVRVHDFLQTGSVHVLVMEYIQGQTLERLLRQHGPLPIERAVGYAAQAAAALQHAADHGVVHRDIKPANLLVDEHDTLKVLDMGLALFFDQRYDGLTQRVDETAVLGTADYIAPEQAVSSQVDIRADIYSLGATLYTLLGGRPPFGGKTTTQKLLAHQLNCPRPLHEVRSEVPVELSAVVARMMAKSPQDRYQTPAEAAAALAPWTPVAASVIPAPRQPASVGRRRWPATIAAGILTVCTAGSGGWWLLAQAAPRPAVRRAPVVEAAPAVPAAVKAVVPPRPIPAPPPPSAPPPVYQLDLSAIGPASWRKSKVDGWQQPHPVPAGWRNSVYDAASTSEFSIGQADGHPTLGLRNVHGKASGMWWLDLGRPPAGRRYHLHLTYLTRGTGRLAVRCKTGEQPVYDLSRQPAASQWRALGIDFDVERPGPVRLEFHNPAVGADNGLHLRNVRVVDIGALCQDHVVARRDWRDVGPFRIVVNHGERVEGDGSLPAGLVLRTWDRDAHAEAALRTVDGQPALALRHLQGRPSLMLFCNIQRIREGRTYRLLVEYRTEGSPRGAVRLRQSGQRAEDLGELMDTVGRWQTASLAFDATASGPAVVELHVRGPGPAHILQVRRLELIEAGVRGR